MSLTPMDLHGLEHAMRKAARGMADAIRKMDQGFAKRKAERTPEQIDLHSQVRYDLRVKHERNEGVAFVKREAARVRKELGL